MIKEISSSQRNRAAQPVTAGQATPARKMVRQETGVLVRQIHAPNSKHTAYFVANFECVAENVARAAIRRENTNMRNVTTKVWRPSDVPPTLREVPE